MSYLSLVDFLAEQPALMCVSHGVKYYEDPIVGDDTTLIAVRGEEVFSTPHWEIEDAIEYGIDDEAFRIEHDEFFLYGTGY